MSEQVMELMSDKTVVLTAHVGDGLPAGGESRCDGRVEYRSGISGGDDVEGGQIIVDVVLGGMQ
eukprot:scaffold229906_cov39-Prasinocladus_malaysianus.AAC.1